MTAVRDEDGIRLKSGTVPAAVSAERPSLCHWDMSRKLQCSGKAKGAAMRKSEDMQEGQKDMEAPRGSGVHIVLYQRKVQRKRAVKMVQKGTVFTAFF